MDLKRSKQKDYYKVLGVPKDADELQIKSAYRKMTRTHHPDKAVRTGVTKEDAEKKMAQINEAYEVLSDPELRARFDRGDDPNSHERQGGGHPFGAPNFGGGGQQFFHQQFKFPGGGGGGGGFQGGGFPF
jgi:DnaJ family protein C protein 3